ncbi:hypothetical protein D9V41_10755 [Aeromicrobium phragmitis]|uniref:Uncharacterized protein n=1 Tax=Aeromicrobium phragmitis TaxID=2478914 RepID=A0A3L8PK03_9ACTN|nr:hypothetical protein [Aeromicrobium phragmitis]RLV55560.1 hypothetical protein D9V41_10755 [Aeromicrobium phragmitis]
MSTPMLATPLPFGWLEIGAFEDADTVEAFVRSRLDTDPADLPAEVTAQVAAALREAHAWTTSVSWHHLGVLVTSVSEQTGSDQRRPTAWTVGVTTMPAPPSREINPAGLIERLLPSRGPAMDISTVRLPDGRDAVSGTGTLSAARAADTDHRVELPRYDPSALGLVTTWVPLPESTVLLGVVAVALSADELAALQLLTVEMAAGAQLVDDPSTLPSERVLVDPDRRVHPDGYLPPALEHVAHEANS